MDCLPPIVGVLELPLVFVGSLCVAEYEHYEHYEHPEYSRLRTLRRFRTPHVSGGVRTLNAQPDVGDWNPCKNGTSSSRAAHSPPRAVARVLMPTAFLALVQVLSDTSISVRQVSNCEARMLCGRGVLIHSPTSRRRSSSAAASQPCRALSRAACNSRSSSSASSPSRA